jgi:hypothetical protein
MACRPPGIIEKCSRATENPFLELLTNGCDSAINVWAYKALPINYFDEKGERLYGNKKG